MMIVALLLLAAQAAPVLKPSAGRPTAEYVIGVQVFVRF